MVGIKTMDTPNPTRIRPANAKGSDGASPKSTLPTAAINRKKVTVRRGPMESDINPAGNCITA